MLERTQPGLSLKPGKCRTMIHDYNRQGTTTLFAALNVLDGTVVGRYMSQHPYQQFIRFHNAIERTVQEGRIIHANLNNYVTNIHPKMQARLADQQRRVVQ
jgi:hypothetical protein